MFHAEIREGGQFVRQFNLDERALWVRYLTPLMSDREFMLEGHEWAPRKTRIIILEGPQLRPDQISMGRGWSNAQRASTDVTEKVLARARELQTSAATAPHVPAPSSAPGGGGGHSAGRTSATDAAQESPASVARGEIVRERLIGRLGAGPLSAAQIEAVAEGAMPGADPAARLAACQRAVWELLAAGEAKLAQGDH